MKLYTVARRLMRIVAHLYFVEIQLSGLENVPRRGPLLIAANHPGSLLDAVLLSTMVPRQINYLAKSDFFRFPVVASVFRGLGIIPIYRAGQAPGHAERNVEAFERVYEVLENEGCIGIFPEGRNSPQRQIAAIRTGVARMALGAEARNDYRLGVSIVPVGVNFESRELLLSSVFLSFDEPISISRYAEEHRSHPGEAVRALTDDVQQSLRRQALHIEDLRLSQLVSDLSQIAEQSPDIALSSRISRRSSSSAAKRRLHKYWSRLLEWFRPEAKTRKDLETALRGRQHISQLLERAVKEEPEAIDELSAAAERYKSHLAQLRLKEDLEHSFDKPVQERLIRLRMTLYALFMAPLALVGFVHNIVPYLLTLFLSRLFKEEAIRGFASFAIGIAAFSLTYLAYGVWFWQEVARSLPLCLLYLAALLWTGFACLRYRRKITRYRDRILVRTFFQTPDHLTQGLRQERQAIISRLQDLQQRYGSSTY